MNMLKRRAMHHSSCSPPSLPFPSLSTPLSPYFLTLGLPPSILGLYSSPGHTHPLTLLAGRTSCPFGPLIPAIHPSLSPSSQHTARVCSAGAPTCMEYGNSPGKVFSSVRRCRYHSASPAVKFSSPTLALSSGYKVVGQPERDSGIGVASSRVPKRGVFWAWAFGWEGRGAEGIRTQRSSISVMM